MTSVDASAAAGGLRTVFEAGPVAGLTDAQLLERFIARRDDGTGFEALLARHGPMVLGVCRAVLRDDHAAEDAFQATFLVLVRRARSVRVGDSLGRWLHGVAWKVAVRARSDAARRRRREASGKAVMPEPATTGPNPEAADEAALLHDELARLPGPFRAPIVLCHLEGLTHEEAARRLGWPVGTVRSRLARGRDKLRARLERRGLVAALGAAGLAGAAASASATVPPALALATRRMASLANTGLTTGISPAVLALTQGALTTMIVTKLKVGLATALASGLVLIGGAGAYESFTEPAQQAEPAPNPLPEQLAQSKRQVVQNALPAPGPFDQNVENVSTARRESAVPPARELAARLKLARSKMAFSDRLRDRGLTGPVEQLEAVSQVEILEGQISDIIDGYQEELELLRLRLELKEANYNAASAREQRAMAELAAVVNLRKLSEKNVSDAEYRTRTANMEEMRAEALSKQIEVREVELLIKLVERRLAQLKPLLADDPAKPTTEPDPNRPAAKPEPNRRHGD